MTTDAPPSSATAPRNPRMALLQPYPFERLRALLAPPWTGPAPDARHARPVDLSIGEPKHAAPAVVRDAVTGALAGLSSYPPTAGSAALRQAIAGWIGRRHGVGVDADRQVLPVNGSREALFAFAQTVIDPVHGGIVVAPNPFYQIYEGAALLAGASLHLVDQQPERGFQPDWSTVPDAVWSGTRLLYVCTPGNPTGAVMSLDQWRTLFDLADRHDFVIASDECYSEIHFDESAPPLGGLAASAALGRPGYRRLVVFSSLSKRSNVPGMRSGFVAGDAALIEPFLKYRTYHGSAMSPVFQAASIAAWNDEQHVRDNRALYRRKFDAVLDVLGPTGLVQRPEAGFYLWMALPGRPGDASHDDARFTRLLKHRFNTAVLPGSYLSRAHGPADAPVDPGAGRVRLALVDGIDACVDGAQRIVQALRV